MASFDENGKYIKTNWKAGDKITATKLNKIEESIEAVNDNDISRHVEADARLDALEAKDVAHDKEFTNVKNLIADNKAAEELGNYEINSRMQFLEDDVEQAVNDMNNAVTTMRNEMNAHTNTVNTNVDNKISAFETEFDAEVAGLKAVDEAIQNDVDVLQNDMAEFDNHTHEEYLPLSGGETTGEVISPSITIKNNTPEIDSNMRFNFDPNTQNMRLRFGGTNGNIFETQGPGDLVHLRVTHNKGLLETRHLEPLDNGTFRLGNSDRRWDTLYLSNQMSINNLNIKVSDNKLIIDGFTGSNDNPNFYIDNTSTLFARGVRPQYNSSNDLGNDSLRWRYIYLNNNPNVSSDRSLKENIEYIGKAKSGLTYEELYNFVKDDLGLATYNFIGQDKLQMNFIAQDLLVNADGTDNKIGQMIVNPVAVPTEEEIEEGKPYPTLSYDMGMYISVLAGALKESINKIEQLEARIQELENK